MPPESSRSKSEFFRFLPPETVIDIISRLPNRTIGICKCVCKSWYDLLRTPQFADFHLSKSVSGLVIHWGRDELKVFEFDNELGLDLHNPHYKPLTATTIDSMELAGSTVLQGSANGLLLLNRSLSRISSIRTKRNPIPVLYVCNPITREYIELPLNRYVYSYHTQLTYGFGVSRMTGQHKVVTILNELDSRTDPMFQFSMFICLVYTLGTGVWRSVTLPTPFLYDEYCSIGVCLKGNLHWVVTVSNDSHCILCLDLETETFSTFSLPNPSSKIEDVGLVVLGDCLCVSDKVSEGRDVDIWLMKEYGDEKSWTKEFVIRKSIDLMDYFCECDRVLPIKVFKDGDILMALEDMVMIYYSNKTKTTTEESELFGGGEVGSEFNDSMRAMVHSSSFLSLHSFPNETVRRF